MASASAASAGSKAVAPDHIQPKFTFCMGCRNGDDHITRLVPDTQEWCKYCTQPRAWKCMSCFRTWSGNGTVCPHDDCSAERSLMFPGAWICMATINSNEDVCGTANYSTAEVCIECNARKPSDYEKSQEYLDSLDAIKKSHLPVPGGWTCCECLCENTPDKSACINCGYERNVFWSCSCGRRSIHNSEQTCIACKTPCPVKWCKPHLTEEVSQFMRAVYCMTCGINIKDHKDVVYPCSHMTMCSNCVYRVAGNAVCTQDYCGVRLGRREYVEDKHKQEKHTYEKNGKGKAHYHQNGNGYRHYQKK